MSRPSLTASDLEELDRLIYECETLPESRRAYMAELILLRKLLGMVRGYRRRMPSMIQHHIEQLPRLGSSLKEYTRIAAAHREELPENLDELDRVVQLRDKLLDKGGPR